MNFDEYKRLAMTTNHDTDNHDLQLADVGLGLAGEAGEVADLIKKHLSQGHPLDLAKVKKELGDILWYAAKGCHVLGFSMDEVAQENIAKLKARYPEGFSVERSLNRKEG